LIEIAGLTVQHGLVALPDRRLPHGDVLGQNGQLKYCPVPTGGQEPPGRSETGPIDAQYQSPCIESTLLLVNDGRHQALRRLFKIGLEAFGSDGQTKPLSTLDLMSV
jgi:hypothetical protein